MSSESKNSPNSVSASSAPPFVVIAATIGPGVGDGGRVPGDGVDVAVALAVEDATDGVTEAAVAVPVEVSGTGVRASVGITVPSIVVIWGVGEGFGLAVTTTVCITTRAVGVTPTTTSRESRMLLRTPMATSTAATKRLAAVRVGANQRLMAEAS